MPFTPSINPPDNSKGWAGFFENHKSNKLIGFIGALFFKTHAKIRLNDKTLYVRKTEIQNELSKKNEQVQKVFNKQLGVGEINEKDIETLELFAEINQFIEYAIPYIPQGKAPKNYFRELSQLDKRENASEDELEEIKSKIDMYQAELKKAPDNLEATFLKVRLSTLKCDFESS